MTTVYNVTVILSIYCCSFHRCINFQNYFPPTKLQKFLKYEQFKIKTFQLTQISKIFCISVDNIE